LGYKPPVGCGVAGSGEAGGGWRTFGVAGLQLAALV